MGADAVVMIEDTDIGFRGTGSAVPELIKVTKSIRAGENIRRRASDIRKGNKVLSAGHRLRAQDLGLLAMLGHARVTVYRKPRAALLSSGDELTPVDQPLQPGKIWDTNSYTLSAMIIESGCETILLGVAPDNRKAIEGLLTGAIEKKADIIISSAGVSVGAMDFIKEIIETEGNLDFCRVNIRPGKPLAVGEFHDIPFIGLPGNPVSAFIGFEIFVRPALGRLAGMQAKITRRKIRVTISEGIESDGRESYLRAIVEEKTAGWTAKLTGHQGSGNLFSLVEANALLIIPAGVKSLPIGSQADAWML
jgi:molybdopterin molybdotransferase